jgi:hypothetical protein
MQPRQLVVSIGTCNAVLLQHSAQFAIRLCWYVQTPCKYCTLYAGGAICAASPGLCAAIHLYAQAALQEACGQGKEAMSGQQGETAAGSGIMKCCCESSECRDRWMMICRWCSYRPSGPMGRLPDVCMDAQQLHATHASNKCQPASTHSACSHVTQGISPHERCGHLH